MKFEGQNAEIVSEMLDFAEIPDSALRHSFETYTGNPEALRDCDKYAKNADIAYKNCLGLFIRGGPETQKTFLACYVLGVLLTKKWVVKYVSMPDLVDAMLQNSPKLLEYTRAASFLVIDNVNSGGNNFWPVALLRILTARRDAGKPTIVVTQFVPDNGRDSFETVFGRDCFNLISDYSQTVLVTRSDQQKKASIAKRKAMFTEEV